MVSLANEIAINFGPPGWAYGIEGSPAALCTVGRPVSIAQSVSGLVEVSLVMYTACTEMSELELTPKGIPFHVVLSWSGGKFRAALGYGSSAVSFTTTPSVYTSVPRVYVVKIRPSEATAMPIGHWS